MRRKDRQVTEFAAVCDIVKSCKVCRVAMRDEDGLYIVPLNFGARWEGEKLTLYFHGAKTGRKISAIQKDPAVAFEMDDSHRLVESEKACGHSFCYRSVIGKGTASLVEDLEEKKQALSVLMRHQTGKDFAIDGRMADQVAVFRIEAESYSAKQRL